MSAFGYRKPADLPQTIPIFPLGGAILFPRGGLPLNIFEPRYLNMIDDALGDNRLIGMIQPQAGTEHAAKPALMQVGTVGRITAFAETEDGRYLVTLTGVCRFRVSHELTTDTPYRLALATYDEFAGDLKQPKDAHIDRERLRHALRTYVDTHGYQADWSAVDDAPGETLVNAAATLCPFDVAAKQALLEAASIEDRCEALIALLEWGAEPEDGAERPLQ